MYIIQNVSMSVKTTGNATVTTNTPHQPGCYYKGQVFHRGETWTDGCDYNCTCDDEQSGHFRCRKLCPEYGKLPENCKLVKHPGECCGKINCKVHGGNITGQTTFCFYKGERYEQDETWIDNCQYKCTCEVAQKGFFRCKDLCVDWTGRLPASCRILEPRPGKCCKQPQCPPWVIIMFPAGYDKNQ